MTTQDEAARLQLNSARIRASELETIVRAPGDAVRVTRLSVLRAAGATTFVVTVRNPHAASVADLPISVGVRLPHGRRLYLNDRSASEFSYFNAHLPIIAAGGELTWVYTAPRKLPANGRHPFVLVGDRPSPAVRLPRTAPVIRARVTAAPGTGHPATLAVSVHNTTDIPQYQLQVYAVARRAGRLLAAGAVTVPHLGSNRTEAVSLPVEGRPTGARVDVVALPTIFQ